jgi:hypothetical protein
MMKQKSIKLWVFLLAFPIPLLVFTALLQVLLLQVFGNSSGTERQADALQLFVNIFSLVAGFVSITALILLPLWIVMLVKTINDNKKLEQSAPPANPIDPASTQVPPSV